MKTKKYFFTASLVCALCITTALTTVNASTEAKKTVSTANDTAKSDSPKAEKKSCCPFKKCCKKEEAKKTETSSKK